MLVSELFEGYADQNMYMLLEDLGTLKAIDPKFLKLFKTEWPTKSLAKGVGRESGYESVVIKNTTDAVTKFKEDKYVGFIVELDGKQIIAAVKHENFGRYSSKKSGEQYPIKVLMDEKYILNNLILSDNDKDFVKYRLSSNGVEISAIQKFITGTQKLAKGQDLEFKFILISKDEKRAEKQGSRAIAKSGRQLTPKEVAKLDYRDKQRFDDAFKYSLKSRLDKYKSSKAVAVDNPNEALKLFIEKGYLDKIKIGKFTYKIDEYNCDIRFKSLRGKDSFGGESYIGYEIENDDDYYDEATKVRKIRNEIILKYEAEGMEKDEAVEKAMDEVKTIMPYRKFKVMLGLQGANIVPTGEIKYS